MPPVTTAAPPARSSSLARGAATLVDASWLLANRGEVHVVDTRRGSDYLDGHVAGACSFALDALLVEDTSRAALDRLARAAQRALAARGVAPDAHVVLVDDSDGSAALGALVCELAGVAAVSVLSGGIAAWIQLTGAPELHPAAVDAVAAAAWSGTEVRIDHLASFEQLLDAVRTGCATILDTRSQLEHEGIVGAPCCAARGALPGSTHLEWTAFLDMSGAPHRPERVREVAGHVGISPEDEVIVTCHAGHRAAVAAMALRAAGFDRVRVSLGSWHEWSARGPRRAEG